MVPLRVVRIKWCKYLLRDHLYDSWQKVIFPLLVFRPWCKEPKLAIVTIIRQPHLGAYEKYLFVVNDDTTIVNHVFMHYRPSLVCSE